MQELIWDQKIECDDIVTIRVSEKHFDFINFIENIIEKDAVHLMEISPLALAVIYSAEEYKPGLTSHKGFTDGNPNCRAMFGKLLGASYLFNDTGDNWIILHGTKTTKVTLANVSFQ